MLFRLVAPRYPGALLLVSTLLPIAACGWLAPSGPTRHNVVLITVDCLRADRLGAYGHDGGLTPNIDELAARSTVFENAYAAAATTFPSHATLFTGLYPRYHGVLGNDYALDESFDTVAERLRATGYATAAFVSFRGMLFNGKLDQGFETISDAQREPDVPVIRGGPEVNELALAWLDNRDERPFFLWLHYFEPHGPYRLHESSREQLEGYEGPFADGASVEQLTSVQELRETIQDPTDRAALEALYEGEVIEADRLVGEIFDAVEKLDHPAETMIVFTADHGQGLGDNGRILGHGPIVWEPVLRVPLIVQVPGQDARRVTTRVGLVDLTPTVLDTLDLEPISTAQGRSLRPALEGNEIEEVPHFAEVEQPHDLAKRRNISAVYLGRHKLVSFPRQRVLFDLGADPHERQRLPLHEHEELLAVFDELLARYQSGNFEPEPIELSPEDLRDLRSLGYLQ